MLCLAGNVIYGRSLTTIASDEERIESMRLARSDLCRMTEVDFGYDLHRWHAYLQKSKGNDKDPYGYKHPYAWSTVRKAIERFIDDPDRTRLVALIQERYPPSPGKQWEEPYCPPPPPPPPPDAPGPTGLPQHEHFTRPDAIPCPACGRPLRTRLARQCFRCGADWH